MTETQRQPVPRNDAGELDTATAFLRFARESVLKKTDGLNDEQLRRVLVDTGTTLLGLVEHLTGVERYWFGYHLAGAGSDTDGDPATDVATDGSTESVLQAPGACTWLTRMSSTPHPDPWIPPPRTWKVPAIRKRTLAPGSADTP